MFPETDKNLEKSYEKDKEVYGWANYSKNKERKGVAFIVKMMRLFKKMW